MNWEIRFLPEAEDDFASLNQSVRPEILKGIRKVAQNPGYPDGYGKPLGNFAGSKLAGLYKIKFKKAGLRVVYALQRVEGKMVVVIISATSVTSTTTTATPRIIIWIVIYIAIPI